MEPTFHGLPVQVLANPFVEVHVLAQAGPRIVRLLPAGSTTNLLAELPANHWETPWGTFFIRGGHRLWHAPEQFPRTYYPDNEGLRCEQIGDELHLIGPVEAGTGMQKTIALRLAPDRAALTVRHLLTNHGQWPLEAAAWAITQMAPGGLAILPMSNPTPSSNHLFPDRQLAFWPYTRLDDPRISLREQFIFVHARTDLPPAKIGALSAAAWIGYLNHGTLLIKRASFAAAATYPDRGCNLECYFDQYNLEIETLGPLSLLAPGATISHTEEWELFACPSDDLSPPIVEAQLAQLLP